ncbi:MAG: QueT transporter family protein [Lachnospiraceae bacterium]|nr:QueT transporter family protein [Lachnospiraceae bacterium]
MRNKKVTMITQSALISALYVVLTLLANALGLSKFAIQIRFSEALCILPFFTKSAVLGLYIGCIIANVLTGATIFDIFFGSLATLIGAIGSYLLRKHKFLLTLPPVLANAIIVPFVLRYGYGIKWIYNGVDLSIPFYAITVGIGEIISICILGSILLKALLPYRRTIFKNE